MAAMATDATAYEAAGGRTRGSQPIADYALLADCNSAALVAKDGSIDWLCLPRYDSSSVFGRILDAEAGHWSIRPAGAFTSERRYLPGTLVVETTFTTESGTVKLTDALAFAEGQRGHDLGYDAPRELLRSVEGVSGDVELLLELAPRTEYGLVRPLFRMEGDGGRTFGGPNRIVARAGVPVEIEDVTMRAAFSVSGRERVSQPHRAAVGRERGLDHERPREVAALARKGPRRPDRPVAGLWVEDATEDGAAVVAGQAEPVDRAVAGDECGRVAVGQEPVLRDRLRAAGLARRPEGRCASGRCCHCSPPPRRP